MHRDGPHPDEPLYVISVAARMVNLHPQTLRHYEKIGLVQPARTHQRGPRLYSQRDIEQLKRITRLIEDLGVNLAGVEVILNMSRQIEELQAKLELIEATLHVDVERLQQAALEDQRPRRPRLPSTSSAPADGVNRSQES